MKTPASPAHLVENPVESNSPSVTASCVYLYITELYTMNVGPMLLSSSGVAFGISQAMALIPIQLHSWSDDYPLRFSGPGRLDLRVHHDLLSRIPTVDSLNLSIPLAASFARTHTG